MEMVHITINNMPLEVEKASGLSMQPKRLTSTSPTSVISPIKPSRLIAGCAWLK